MDRTSTAPARRVIVIGNLTVDDVVRGDGTVTMGCPGGNAVYAAVAARLWHGAVGVVARRGTDLPPEIPRTLQDLGVDLAGLRSVTGPTVRNWVIYEEDGRRRWLYRTPPERSREVAVRPADIPQDWLDPPAPQAPPPVVHIAAMPLDAAARLVAHVREHSPHALVTLDTHEDWHTDPDAVLALARQVEVFVPSREELAALAGYDDPEQAAALLRGRGVPAVVVKLGAQGALVDAADRPLLRIPAWPADVADPTGAGDTFCGALAAALGAGLSLTGAVRRAAATAAWAVADSGSLALSRLRPQTAAARFAAGPPAATDGSARPVPPRLDPATTTAGAAAPTDPGPPAAPAPARPGPATAAAHFTAGSPAAGEHLTGAPDGADWPDGAGGPAADGVRPVPGGAPGPGQGHGHPHLHPRARPLPVHPQGPVRPREHLPSHDIGVMRREIAMIPDVIAAHIADPGGHAERIAGELAARGIEDVFLVGCGDSQFAGQAARLAFQRHAGVRAHAVHALDFARYQVRYLPERSAVVCVSFSGKVGRTTEAALQAGRFGAPAVALTNNADGELGRAADLVLPIDVPTLGFSPGTSSYLGLVATLDDLALRWGRARGRATAAARAGLEAIPALAERTLRETAEPARVTAVSLAGPGRAHVPGRWPGDTPPYGPGPDHGRQPVQPRPPAPARGDGHGRQPGQLHAPPQAHGDGHPHPWVTFLGAGPNEASARFGAAKLFEGPQLLAVSTNTEEWAHEEYFVSSAGTPVVLVAPSGASADRAAEILSELHFIGARAFVVSDLPPGPRALHLPLAPGAAEEFSPLLAALPLSLLGFHLAETLGKESYNFPSDAAREEHYDTIHRLVIGEPA